MSGCFFLKHGVVTEFGKSDSPQQKPQISACCQIHFKNDTILVHTKRPYTAVFRHFLDQPLILG